jgi:hypothetical protein
MTATQTRTDVLASPIDGLEQALSMDHTGHEREWADSVSGALTNVHQALRLHAAATEGSDGLLLQVDLTRPTLARQVGDLRREHNELFAQARLLEGQLQTAGEAFHSADSAVSATALPRASRVAEVPDFGVLRRSAVQLLTSLQHHVDEEAKLILESVNTDIGVGD